MKRSVIGLAILVASGHGIAADSFDTEVGGIYFNSDAIDIYGLGGTYFFDQVSTTKGPLAEASFLDLQSSVSVLLAHNEIDKDDFNLGIISGTYSLEGSGAFVTGSIAHFSDIDGPNNKLYGFGAGYYLRDDWAVLGEAEFDEDLEYLGFAVGTKKLLSLGGDRFLNLEARYNNVDSGKDSFSVSSDYYVNSNFSVGIGVAWDDELFDPDESVYTVRTEWFVSPSVSIQAAVDYIDGTGDSDTAFTLGASARF